jgi:hypothetical protein
VPERPTPHQGSGERTRSGPKASITVMPGNPSPSGSGLLSNVAAESQELNLFGPRGDPSAPKTQTSSRILSRSSRTRSAFVVPCHRCPAEFPAGAHLAQRYAVRVGRRAPGHHYGALRGEQVRCRFGRRRGFVRAQCDCRYLQTAGQRAGRPSDGVSRESGRALMEPAERTGRSAPKGCRWFVKGRTQPMRGTGTTAGTNRSSESALQIETRGRPIPCH